MYVVAHDFRAYFLYFILDPIYLKEVYTTSWFMTIPLPKSANNDTIPL
jgi:hypothetical protein